MPPVEQSRTALAESGPNLEDPSNGDIARFIRDNAKRLFSYSDLPLRVAVIFRARDLDLRSWPGDMVAEELQSQSRSCGIPAQYVGLNDDFDLLIGFASSGPSEQVQASDYQHSAEALRRNRIRVIEEIGSIYKKQLTFEVRQSHGDNFERYPYDRYLRSITYDLERSDMLLAPRRFLESWSENFDIVVAEINALPPQSDAQIARLNAFRNVYLNGVFATCPNTHHRSLLRAAKLNADPELVTSVMRDGRVRPGMNAGELFAVSLDVLNELRPGR